jgi:uncharacterized protein (TIGR00730 family)
MKKFATTFGNSRVKSTQKKYKEGIELGKVLVKYGYSVRCGGYQGLMEAVSKGVKQANGECIGITVAEFDKTRPKNIYLSKRIIASDIFERLKLLIEDSTIFIAQTGNLGTLNEVILIWTLMYTHLKNDARICLLGKEWNDLKRLKNLPIDKRLFKHLEFFDTLEEFEITLKKNFKCY